MQHVTSCYHCSDYYFNALLALPAAVCRHRLLSFSVPVAVAQLSSCCLAGDVHAAMAALTPAIKGVWMTLIALSCMHVLLCMSAA
jgi:hypothetical protein